VLDKIIYAAFAVYLIVSGLYMVRAHNRTLKLTEAKARTEASLTARITDCEQAVRDAEAAITRQNTAIEKLRIDTIKVTERFDNVVKIYAETRQEAAERVEKDTGCENKIAVINDIMRTFSELRTESRNKNRVP